MIDRNHFPPGRKSISSNLLAHPNLLNLQGVDQNFTEIVKRSSKIEVQTEFP